MLSILGGDMKYTINIWGGKWINKTQALFACYQDWVNFMWGTVPFGSPTSTVCFACVG